MRVAILTISDSVARAEREDLSGPALVARCRELGWEANSALRCSDNPEQVRNQIRTISDSGDTDMLLTTGGTGLGPRDNTPEAT
ncbi:MAG: molybdopterin-binding protein, partial [Candidatus Acidiferrum sp.]